ncbi:MAG: OmpH family outer membrane protein [Marinilabiliaceae bacterium]|nr:OmpH family outer membrane protein [Marinilabiliaceae bacterium]
MKSASGLNSAVIVVAMLGLSSLMASCSGSSSSVSEKSEAGQEAAVVYVNTDSLLLNYEFAKFLNEELMKKEEQSRTDFNEKARVFQQDATEFQRKVQNNGFLSLDRAKQEEQRLAAKERELQEMNSRLSNQLMVEQNNMNKQLRDTIVTYLKELQKVEGYKMVLSNTMGDNVLFADPSCDITPKVIEGLNKRYVKK